MSGYKILSKGTQLIELMDWPMTQSIESLILRNLTKTRSKFNRSTHKTLWNKMSPKKLDRSNCLIDWKPIRSINQCNQLLTLNNTKCCGPNAHEFMNVRTTPEMQLSDYDRNLGIYSSYWISLRFKPRN